MPLTIPLQQALAFTLARQHISQPAADPLEAVRRLVLVQSQYDASVPVAIWARTQSLSTTWTDEQLYRQRGLVKTWSVRSTVHVLAAADLALLTAAVGRPHREAYLRFWQNYLSGGPEEVEQLYSEMRAVLRRHGPLSRADLHDAIPRIKGMPWAGWGVDVKGLAYHGELIFADPRNGQKRFALREQWLPDLPWDPPAEEAARAELFTRYLRAYGPASLRDFARWTGRLAVEVRATAKAMAERLLEVQVDGWPEPAFILAEDEAALRGPQPEPPAAAFLPKFETPMLAYHERAPRFFRPEDRTRISRPAGQVEAVVLLRDQIAATWRYEKKGKAGFLRVYPFRPLSAAEQAAITARGEELAAFLQPGQPAALEIL